MFATYRDEHHTLVAVTTVGLAHAGRETPGVISYRAGTSPAPTTAPTR